MERFKFQNIDFNKFVNILNFCSLWSPFLYLIAIILRWNVALIKFSSAIFLFSIFVFSCCLLIKDLDLKLLESRETNENIENRKRVDKNKIFKHWNNTAVNINQQKINYNNVVDHILSMRYKNFVEKLFSFAIFIFTFIVSEYAKSKNLDYYFLLSLVGYVGICYGISLMLLHVISKENRERTNVDYPFLCYTILTNIFCPILLIFYIFYEAIPFSKHKESIIVLVILLLIVNFVITISLYFIIKKSKNIIKE